MVRERISKHREEEKQFELQKAQEELLVLIGQIKALFGREMMFDEYGRVVSRIRVGDVENNEEWVRAGALIVKVRQMVEKGAKIPAEDLGNGDICQNPSNHKSHRDD